MLAYSALFSGMELHNCSKCESSNIWQVCLGSEYLCSHCRCSPATSNKESLSPRISSMSSVCISRNYCEDKKLLEDGAFNEIEWFYYQFSVKKVVQEEGEHPALVLATDKGELVVQNMTHHCT